MTAVEVCPICDIAGCRHSRERKAKMTHQTDEELDALVAQQTRAANKRDEFEALMNADRTVRAITALRAQLADVQADLTFMTENRNKWQDSANQRWFRIEEAEARAAMAEDALADADAMIEALAKDYAENNIRLAETSYRTALAEAALAAQIEADARIAEDAWLDGVPVAEISAAIRAQPHDHSALAKYREKVLQEAADELKDQGYNTAVRQILALINKENVI